MGEYIDKQAVYEVACRGCSRHGDEPMSCYNSELCERLTYEFVSAPAADVAPVRRGKWVLRSRWHDSIDENVCSECEQMLTTAAGKRMNYCPNCGAKMNGGVDEW